jgi:hypothetical protein
MLPIAILTAILSAGGFLAAARMMGLARSPPAAYAAAVLALAATGVFLIALCCIIYVLDPR